MDRNLQHTVSQICQNLTKYKKQTELSTALDSECDFTSYMKDLEDGVRARKYKYKAVLCATCEICATSRFFLPCSSLRRVTRAAFHQINRS